MTLELLKSAGLKPELAARVASGRAAEQLRDTFLQLAATAQREVTMEYRAGSQVDRNAVVDAFGMLGRLAQAYFNSKRRLTVSQVEPLLQARYDLSRQAGFHASPKEFARAVTARASFENKPLSRLFYPPQYAAVIQAVDTLRWEGDALPIQREIEDATAASLRNFDGLLRRGRARVFTDGTWELQALASQGVFYSLVGGALGERVLRVEVKVVAEGESYRVTAGDEWAGLQDGQLADFELAAHLEGHSAALARRVNGRSAGASPLRVPDACTMRETLSVCASP